MILSETGNGGSFKLAPEGSWAAACVDFVDLGMVETTWEGQTRMQHKCRVVFEFQDDAGEWFIASRRYTVSLNERAALRQMLEAWRGRAFTADELRAFDTDQLIGANAVIGIAHVTRGDRTYDNIQTVMRPMRGMAKIEPSGTYVRVKDREQQQQNGAAPEAAAQASAPQRQPAPVADDADFPPALEDVPDDGLPF